MSSIGTGYELDDRGVSVRVPAGSRKFLTLPRPAMGSTQPPYLFLQKNIQPQKLSRKLT
jgi:hypothetical protein